MRKISEWVLKMTDNGISQKLDKITHAGDKASQAFDKIQSFAGRTQAKFTEVKSGISGFFSDISSRAGDLLGKAKGLISKVPLIGSRMAALASPVGLAVAALTAFVAISVSGIQKAAELEASIADLSAITGIYGDELDFLNKQAIKLGGETGLGANQVAESYKLLASNIEVAEIGGVKALDKLAQSTITLSKAAGVALPEAADTMSFAINQFKLAASDSDRVINSLAAGAKFGAAEIPDLAASLKVTGVIAAQSKVSLESTVAAIETLSKVGIKGAEAGTGLRNVLLKLQTRELPGVDLKADGLTNTLRKLEPKLEDTAYLTKIFGAENVGAAQALLANIDTLDRLTGAVTGTSIAFEQAAIRDSTYAAAQDRFRETWNGLKIELGQQLLPVLTGFFDKMTGFLNWLQEDGNGTVAAFSAAWGLVKIPLEIAWGMITAVGDAIQGVSERLQGTTGWLGRFLQVSRDVFTSFANLVSGVMTNVAELMNPLNWFDRSKMRSAFNDLQSVVKDFGSNIGDAFSAKLAAATYDPVPGTGPDFNKVTDNNKADLKKPGGSDNIKDSLTGSGGGGSGRTVNVRIDKLIEQFVVNSSVKESAADLERVVQEALIRAVRGSEIAVSN